MVGMRVSRSGSLCHRVLITAMAVTLVTLTWSAALPAAGSQPCGVTRFDPRHASTSQLAAVDFPPRPAQRDAARAWDRYAANYAAGKVKVDCTIAGTTAPSERAGDKVRVAATDTNWAGIAVHNATFTDTMASFRVPAATGGSSAFAAEWVGVNLGHSTSHPLVQAGALSRGDGTSFFWSEIYPQQPKAIQFHKNPDGSNVNVSGHFIFVHVRLSPTGDASFHVVDYTANYDYHPPTVHVAGATPDGHAEAIVELPIVNGVRGPFLANFGVETFFNAEAAGTGFGWKYYNQLVNYPLVISNEFDQWLAAPGSLDTVGDFPVNWLRSS
jgi:hypothetical protein